MTVKHIALSSGIELISEADTEGWETKGYIKLISPFALDFNPMLALMSGEGNTVALVPWCSWVHKDEKIVLLLKHIITIVTISPVMEKRYRAMVMATEKAKKKWDKEDQRQEAAGLDPLREEEKDNARKQFDEFIEEFMPENKKKERLH